MFFECAFAIFDVALVVVTLLVIAMECIFGEICTVLKTFEIVTRVQSKEGFFRQKMGLTIFNIDLTN